MAKGFSMTFWFQEGLPDHVLASPSHITKDLSLSADSKFTGMPKCSCRATFSNQHTTLRPWKWRLMRGAEYTEQSTTCCSSFNSLSFKKGDFYPQLLSCFPMHWLHFLIFYTSFFPWRVQAKVLTFIELGEVTIICYSRSSLLILFGEQTVHQVIRHVSCHNVKLPTIPRDP